MAKKQNFVVNSEVKLEKELVGQAKRVYDELVANPVPRTGEEIDEAIRNSDTPFATRQDTLRVTLYYLVVFKGRGIVTATRPSSVPTEQNAFAGDFTPAGELINA